MNVIRAKLKCTLENNRRYSVSGSSNREYEFHAVYDDSISEDQRFAKATPSATLKMFVDNPAVNFVPGNLYYIDFIEA